MVKIQWVLDHYSLLISLFEYIIIYVFCGIISQSGQQNFKAENEEDKQQKQFEEQLLSPATPASSHQFDSPSASSLTKKSMSVFSMGNVSSLPALDLQSRIDTWQSSLIM